MKFYSPLILIFLIVILFYGTAFAQPADKESYLIKINEHFDKSAFEKQKGEIRSQTGNIISVWLPKENVDSVKAMKGVEVVSPARKIQPLLNQHLHLTKSAYRLNLWEQLLMFLNSCLTSRH